MEIAPDIHMISGLVGTRPLQLFLLRGHAQCVLLDTGCAPDPEQIIFPYLHSIGMDAQDIGMVINTHCDMDHCGGNRSMKRANPAVQITCGALDRELIEDPGVMWGRRYNAYDEKHGIHYDNAIRKSIFEAMGEPQPVDRTWRGGERIDLGDGWQVGIHPTPGHSKGHLAVFDPRSRTMLSGDAVHGAMYPDIGGRSVLCPTYLEPASYLATIDYLDSLPIACLATCHWPLKRGPAVREFMAESRGFVQRAEEAVLTHLTRNPAGLTLRELIAGCGPMLGSWPRAVDGELVYALAGHLDILLTQNRITEAPGTRPAVFRMASR
ncbi:MAG TPA: MBL fold metallo-hydrolase [Acidobacteriaceae bacterium]|jgi:glyoxylase-like metal-dependent hydrolase (beta-lactamase superfamily II)|nr:MBL fold metallo-hydrolase [Acidobacteriaceae bacterium]